MKKSLIMQFFALISIMAAPVEIKTCSSMNTQSFSVSFAQHVVLKEATSLKWFHENWLCFDEDTVNLVSVVEIDLKNSNQPNEKGTMCSPQKTAISDKWEAVWSPRDLMINRSDSHCKKDNSQWIHWQILKTPINQTKKEQCVPPGRQQSLTNEKLFDLPGIIWSILPMIEQRRWINEFVDLLWTMSFFTRRSTTASICCFVSFWYLKMRRSRVGDFWIFLVLKNA